MKMPFKRSPEDRHARNLSTIQSAMGDAWLRNHLGTRFFRWILGILISFVAATAFVQTTERENCEQGKPFLKAYVQLLDNSIEVREKGGTTVDDARAIREYQGQKDLLSPGINIDCGDQYPILPLVGI